MNGLFDLLKHLEVDEARDIVTVGETFGDFQAMLGDASDEVVCNADVESSAYAAGKNVDVVLS
jgi:hypothetical protein